MADLIQFSCPFCGASLKVPANLAGATGPCPCCSRDIAAPCTAVEMTSTPVSSAPEPPRSEPEFRPLVEPATSVPTAIGIVDRLENKGELRPSEPAAAAIPNPSNTDAVPPQTPVVKVSCSKASRRAVLIFFFLLNTVLALLTGYFIGSRPNWLVSRITPPVLQPSLPPSASLPPSEPGPSSSEPLAKPVTVAATPVEEPKEQPVNHQAAPVMASEAAEAALKAFLNAPDWTARSAYVLTPEKVRTAMEIHSRKSSDGPTAFQSISLNYSHTDAATGVTTFIFKVITNEHPTGVPVALRESPSGWQVDWETFIEFRDDLFKQFVDGPPDQTGCFHLVVSPPPQDRAARTENEHFVSFLLDPPFPDRQQLAYVRKNTPAQICLSKATTSGVPTTPVIELVKKTSPDGKHYLEIVSVKATNWLPKTD